MKKILSIYTNWRVLALAVLTMFAFTLLLGETDDLFQFVIIKALGFGVAYIIYRLVKYWDSKGKINDLMALANEE